MKNNLCLHVPIVSDLWYRENLLSEPNTMSYNKNYDVSFDGYDSETGCIKFPESAWQNWHDWFINNEPARFYAYISHDGTFIGEVNVRLSDEKNKIYDMGIVIEAKHRGNAYSVEALKLLLKYAFENLKAEEVQNSFESNRKIAIKTHVKAGFKIINEENGICSLTIMKSDYNKFYQKI